MKNMHTREIGDMPLGYILERAQVKMTPSEIIGTNRRLKSFLKKTKNNNWVLKTRRSSGKTLYALEKYGDETSQPAEPEF